MIVPLVQHFLEFVTRKFLAPYCSCWKNPYKDEQLKDGSSQESPPSMFLNVPLLLCVDVLASALFSFPQTIGACHTGWLQRGRPQTSTSRRAWPTKTANCSTAASLGPKTAAAPRDLSTDPF